MQMLIESELGDMTKACRMSEFLGGESRSEGGVGAVTGGMPRMLRWRTWGTAGGRSPAGGGAASCWRQQSRAHQFRSGQAAPLLGPRPLGEALSPLSLHLLG